MWGTLERNRSPPVRIRFIPTHVGNTTAALASVSPMNGSSPRMWGTHEHACKNIQIRRFIPTHVGNTWYPGLRASAPPVHPHACGEHFPGKDAQEYSDGSSPRMWGTPSRPAPASSCHRFIPTHVGNTMRSAMPRCGRAVHPHACGEHNLASLRILRLDGSSPRMWGTRRPFLSSTKAIRFIPTHVGNTRTVGPASYDLAVHPHACGEHTYRTALFLKKKKHFEKSTASSSIPWSDPEAGMPPIAARRTTLDVDG